VHKRREARGLTSIGKQVRHNHRTLRMIPDTFWTESWAGQGSSSQPHTRSLDLEEAQHAQPSSLPVILCTVVSCFVIFHPTTRMFAMVVCSLKFPKYTCTLDSQQVNRRMASIPALHVSMSVGNPLVQSEFLCKQPRLLRRDVTV
jgi:hypothetical protein